MLAVLVGVWSIGFFTLGLDYLDTTGGRYLVEGGLATATLGIVVALAAWRQLIRGDGTAVIIATLPFFTVYVPSVLLDAPYAAPWYLAIRIAGGVAVGVPILFAFRTSFGWWGSPPHRVMDAHLAAGASWRFSVLGNPGQAISRAEQAIAFCPNVPNGYDALAHAYEQDGQVASAHLAFKRGLAACPNDVNLLRGCGVLATKESRDDDARECFERLLRLAPHDSWARKGEPWIRASLALIYQRAGRTEDAVAHARRAVELAPDEPRYREVLRDLESE
jgi:tetratricopeptide (TPR) repeat protein